MSFYGKRYNADMRIKSNHFILSNVNATFLKRNSILMSVEEFKRVVKASTPVFIVCTGGAGHIKRTKVYDIKQFEKYQNLRKCKNIKEFHYE